MTPVSLSVCVIGAGSSGIAAVKALAQRGIAFDCFEKSDRVGGNWVFRNTNGMSSAYRSLHINTSRDRMAYSDFPMPDDYPDFPHHTQVAAYFDAYVDHFGLRERITFETGVEHAEPRRRRLAGAPRHAARAPLRRAAGRQRPPLGPALARARVRGRGRLRGRRRCTRTTTSATTRRFFAGKRVVVLGMGNSAMDIAVEASQTAERVFLAARRGAWIVPKYVFGRPLDQFVTSAAGPARGPPALHADRRCAPRSGTMERYGLPKPDHRPLEAHPTI